MTYNEHILGGITMDLQSAPKSKIAYRRIGNENSTHTLLFIHGAGGASDSLLDLALHFKDYNCILVDLPGHGQSVEDIPSSITGYVDVLENFINSEKLLFKDNVTCIGYSMGGMISMSLALRKIPVIKRIVILSSSAKLNLNPKFTNQIHKGILDKVYLFKVGGSYFHPRTYKFFLSTLKTLSDEVMIKDFILSEQFSLTDQIKDISVPTLIVTGGNEILATPDDSKFLHSNIKDSELEIIPKLAHLLPIVAHEKLSERILEFISK